jgi:type I restriction enzyme S subunit
MDLLQKHFDIALETPDGIEKLRVLILNLAVQGKLAAQGLADQPILQLLEIIRNEKIGAVKPQQQLPPIASNEIPYEIPEAWQWVRLGEIVEVLDSRRKPVTKQDRKPGPYPYYGASGIVDYVSNFLFDEPLVLVGEDGAKWNPGDYTAFSIKGKTWVNNHAHVLRPLRQVLIDNYLIHALVGMDLNPFVTGMTVPKLNQTRLVSILIPLPPLEEQKRIVAKIDQLMALCDKLEAERNARDQKRVTVHTAAMNRLLSSPDKPNFDSSWQFITKHFSELYSVRPNVAELKKAILQLAVMGKLVPQDPNDQPASELLKEIEAEKARLVKEGQIKKQEPLPAIKEDEIPYALPQGWEWVRLGDIAEGFQYGTSSKSAKSGKIPVLRMGNIQNGSIDWENLAYTNSKMEKEQYALAEGDLLFNRTNSRELVGKTALFTDTRPAIFAGYLVRFSMLGKTHAHYANNVMQSTLHRTWCDANKSDAIGQSNINASKLRAFVFPLPPLAEQQRIVAKIDQLMALCDALEKQIGVATEKKTAILNAVLAGV